MIHVPDEKEIKKKTRVKITKKTTKLFNEIEQQAICHYLDKNDFDISDWIAEEDLPFWRKYMMAQNGSCSMCGEEEKNCECED